jgi:hypothetical protein
MKDTRHSVLAVDSEFEIFTAGGEFEFADHVLRLRVRGTDDLKAGHKYVLFLTDGKEGEPLLAWGALAVFDVTSGRVAGIARAAESRRFDGQTLGQFLSSIH